ncbi:hypothetical protein GGR57DRAFT_507036 [Xylariaceae sp. FL1272]|nr:hypothetical protein GGR57DRAFT_507036 [Xylariaceae sp. FL1272]
MTRSSPRVSDDPTRHAYTKATRSPRAHLSVSPSHHSPSHNYNSPTSSSPRRTNSQKNCRHRSSTSSQTHGPSPLKMVTTTTPSHPHTDETQYYYLPGVDVSEEELQCHGWMEPIVIDDDDLMFGGKSLSTWYEEERESQSLGFPLEEEHRGRQRERQHYSPPPHPHHDEDHHHHHHNHHQHHHHRHPHQHNNHHHHQHSHHTSSMKTSSNTDQKRH